jgi:plastocyanin
MKTSRALSAALAFTIVTAAHAGTVQIDIAKFAFTPKEIAVAPGTTIVWTNHDETPHTIAAGDKSFASKGLDTGDTFERAFDKEGDYAYLCTVHPFMTGVVHAKKP